MHVSYKTTGNREYKKAIRFFAFMSCVLFGLIILSLSSIDSVILGSELNGDGTVEYLCLGSSCEGLTKMDW